MSRSVEESCIPRAPPDGVCRGCLKEWGEMKNMFETGLNVDFFKYTDIPMQPSDGLPELLCGTCETDLNNIKKFRYQCQESDKILKKNLKVKPSPRHTRKQKAQITSTLSDNIVTIKITAPNPNDKIRLKCPIDNCLLDFNKNIHLLTHIDKSHGLNDVELDLKYYCTEVGCIYNKDSSPNKHFSGRKFLNQHRNKCHKDKSLTCETCKLKFSTETVYYRHLKTCNLIFLCAICQSTYATNESYMVHLARRHPNLHTKYKQEKKAQKRTAVLNNNRQIVPSKLVKLVPKDYVASIDNSTLQTEVPVEDIKEVQQPDTEERFPWDINADVLETTVPVTDMKVMIEDEYCDIIPDGEHIMEEIVEDDKALDDIDLEAMESKSLLTEFVGECPLNIKRTSATQVPEHITNDVAFNAWDNKIEFEIQTDDMSTQTVFEDLLKSNQDDIFFSESVSLSDIQTQTVPLEFGLTQNNKGTQSQGPGLSFKETQTNFDFESPKRNFRMFDSTATLNSFISNAQTQTVDARSPIRSDVLLSFSSAETQTCYDDFSNGGM